MFKLFVCFITFIFFAESDPCQAQHPGELKFKDFRPKSIYRVPVTIIKKAKFPVVDMHSHDYAKTNEEVAQWVQTMDQAGIERRRFGK